jgi:hypothetical protein
MAPVSRQIDPAEIAGWLVRSVAQRADEPDDLLARLTGTTRAQIAAARAAAIQRGTVVRLDAVGGSPPVGAGVRWRRQAA